MFFGVLLFVAFVGVACFGVVMLIASLALCFIPSFRRYGKVMLGAGMLGLFIGLALSVLLNYALGPQAESFIVIGVLFSAAGFGFASFCSVGILIILHFLNYPNRWIDRQRRSSI